MKKLIAFTLAALCAAPLWALRPGDQAAPLDGVRMIRGKNLNLAPASDKFAPPALRAVVVLLCRAVDSPGTVVMLNDIQRRNRDKLAIEIVTPDAASDAHDLIGATGGHGVAFGLDPDRKLTRKYMEGALLYPMAFLIDRKGTIVWCGEAMDLAEKIEPALAGRLDPAGERKILALVVELQQLMRDNSDNKMKQVADKIFKLEPGNASAMRIRLFYLTNTNRADVARDLIDSQLKAAPKLSRLYFTAVDFAAGSNCSNAELERLVGAFERNITDPVLQVRMAWMLLDRFPYYPSALRAAAKILRRPLPQEPLARANAAAGRALLEYRLGNLEAAINYQDEAVKLLNHDGTTAELESAKARAVFFRAALEIGKKH